MGLNTDMAGAPSPDHYFAGPEAEYYGTEFGDELQGKVDDYYNFLTSSALVQLWRRSYYAYYGLLISGAGSGFGMFAIGTIIPSGLEGEVAKLKINHYSNLVDHQHVLVTQDRPALETRAVNSDSKSLAASYLADGVLDYFFREKKLEVNWRDACFYAQMFGEGFVRFDWDAQAGQAYGVGPNGAPLYEGDLVAKTYHPFDVVRDVSLVRHQDRSWYIFRDPINKWDLVAKYPHLRQEILNCSSSNDSVMSTRRFLDPTKVIQQMGSSITGRDSVLVDQFEFLHEPTPSCPDGRYTVFLQGGQILFDGPLPFSHLPGYRVAAGEVFGSPFGWTHNFDLLGLQEAIDKLYTVDFTNSMATGMQCLWQPLNNGLAKSDIQGLSLLESAVKPEVLNLCATPENVVRLRADIAGVMETLSGISAVSRGQTPENLKSGSALAFVNATSLSFASGAQNSSNQLLEAMGMGVVDILRDFATTPRIATIAGSANLPLMKSYSGNDFQDIDRVTVEVTSAISKTTAGKIQIAQDLLQSGLVKTPQEYITVVTTGKLEPLYEGEMAEILLVRSENEAMRAGEAAMAIILDEHAFHIAEHRALLASMEARKDPRLVQTVLMHIQQHEMLQLQLQTTQPALLAATHQGPLPYPTPAPVAAAPAGPPQARPVPDAGQVQRPPQNSGMDARPSALPKLPAGSPQSAIDANDQFKK